MLGPLSLNPGWNSELDFPRIPRSGSLPISSQVQVPDTSLLGWPRLLHSLFQGLGSSTSGRYDVGKYSTIAEATLWVFYTAVELYSDQVRSDAISYARVYAGAQVTGKPDQFFVDIGNFLNTEDYNVKKIHDGDYTLIYPNTPSSQWQWQSDADRARFKNLRIKADQYLNYGRYTAAVIILNHLISAIDAARLAANVNASVASSLNGSPETSGVYLKLAASF